MAAGITLPPKAMSKPRNSSSRSKTGPTPPWHCPHCRSQTTVRWGAAHGLPRHRCKACGQTFNVLTKTPLARLRHRKRWLALLDALGQQTGARKSALACGVSMSTFVRWQRRIRECGSRERLKILGALLAAGLLDLDAFSEVSVYQALLPLIRSLLG